jgi:hypothetical protein
MARDTFCGASSYLQIDIQRNRAFLLQQTAVEVLLEQGVEMTMPQVHFGVLDRLDLFFGELERREASPATVGRNQVVIRS